MLIGNREDFPGNILILWLFLLLFYISHKKPFSSFAEDCFSAWFMQLFLLFGVNTLKSRRYSQHLYLSTELKDTFKQMEEDVLVPKSLSGVHVPRAGSSENFSVVLLGIQAG